MINPNYMTHLDHVDRIIITWSEWRESNPRPHGPEPCALPTALHPDTALPLYGIRFGMSRHIAENPRIENAINKSNKGKSLVTLIFLSQSEVKKP